MRFTITRENLHHGLAAVAATIPTRTTLPVLSNLMLEAEGDGVRVSGTDLDIAVSLKVPAEVDEPGALTPIFLLGSRGTEAGRRARLSSFCS